MARATHYFLPNNDVADIMLALVEDWDPYNLWLVSITDGNKDPGDEYYFYCYNCIYYLSQ